MQGRVLVLGSPLDAPSSGAHNPGVPKKGGRRDRGQVQKPLRRGATAALAVSTGAAGLATGQVISRAGATPVTAQQCASPVLPTYDIFTRARLGDGYYAHSAAIEFWDPTATGFCTTSVNTGPAGYVRAKNTVRFYNGSGDTVCAYTGYSYNSSGNLQVQQDFYWSGCGTGKYYRNQGTGGASQFGSWYMYNNYTPYKYF